MVRHSRRDELKDYLLAKGVQSLIHYPLPAHKQEAYTELGNMSLPITEKIHDEVLSLPMSSVLSVSSARIVIDAVNGFS